MNNLLEHLNFNTRGRTVNELVVHCSATPPTHNWGAREIDSVHRRRGFTGIGYHYVIRRDTGYIEMGRNPRWAGAHVYGHNEDTLGICLVGGVNEFLQAENNFTDQQMHSLSLLLEALRAYYPYADILGHRDYSPDLNGDGEITSNEWLKDCPCFDVRQWLRDTTLLSPQGLAMEHGAGELIYLVEDGDTLSALAKRYGTTVRAIMESNDDYLQNPHEIIVGDVLYIPMAD